jgi:hypothetical protein
MDKSVFDGLARHLGSGLTRRRALRGLVAGAVAVATGGAIREETAAKRRNNKRRMKGDKNKNKNKKNKGNQGTPPSPPAPPICAGKNWCVDRTQTCGPEGGYGKCLISTTGDNICAEILFQVPSCTDCEAPNCTNCRCALAAGGGDRCNNGANGYDYICVREV